MGWRWRESVSLGGGARTTLTAHGMGISWGIGGLRVGRSPTGSLWVSFTIPGTGIGFIKYLSSQASRPRPNDSNPQFPLHRP
jgi:hypothetical protein